MYFVKMLMCSVDMLELTIDDSNSTYIERCLNIKFMCIVVFQSDIKKKTKKLIILQTVEKKNR